MTDLSFILSESIKDTFKNLLLPYRAIPQKKGADSLHLQKTIEWLEKASEHGKGGVSSHYSLIKGDWLPPFPETTGYIIPTLYDYSKFTGEDRFSKLAEQLCIWLGEVQLDNGACMQGNYDEKKGKTAPIIFNTGQNILGFLRTYKETSDSRFLQHAKKAGDFLVASTDQNGVWDKNLHRGLKHTINVRCSWALLLLNETAPDKEYVRVATANLNWAKEQQTENAWFRHGTSRPGGLPNTHFLSYTCEGFLESYLITKNKDYLMTSKRTADKLLDLFSERKMLYAFWDENWKNRGKRFRFLPGRFVCLTGNIQISIVWMQLFRETGESKYIQAARTMLNFIKSIHDVDSGRYGTEGGVKGSFPVYGSYSTLMYPNWAAKYFADALMMKISLNDN